MDFVDKYIAELIEREGGYVNHPSDRGGPTMYGITEQVARAYGYRGGMSVLSKAVAADIYKSRYWREPGFAHINNLLPKVAEELFDTGVNMGPKAAAKMLQRALNVLNKRGNSYPDIGVDGDIGNMTIDALRRFIANRGKPGAEAVMLRMLNAQQAVRYMEIAEKNPTQEDFLYGWVLNRVE